MGGEALFHHRVDMLRPSSAHRACADARRDSGGDGAHRGGDGVVREIEVLAPMRYTLITERRRPARTAPTTDASSSTLVNAPLAPTMRLKS